MNRAVYLLVYHLSALPPRQTCANRRVCERTRSRRAATPGSDDRLESHHEHMRDAHPDEGLTFCGMRACTGSATQTPPVGCSGPRPGTSHPAFASATVLRLGRRPIRTRCRESSTRVARGAADRRPPSPAGFRTRARRYKLAAPVSTSRLAGCLGRGAVSIAAKPPSALHANCDWRTPRQERRTTPAAEIGDGRVKSFQSHELSAVLRAQRRRWISPQATGNSASSGAPRAVIGPGS